MPANTFSPRLRSALLWLPVPLPLAAGAAFYLVGLHYQPITMLNVSFLLIGTWGAAAGLFSGLVLAGGSFGGSFKTLALAASAGPVVVALATGLLALPVSALFLLLDVAPAGLNLAVTSLWFLVSAAAGVEALDRTMDH